MTVQLPKGYSQPVMIGSGGYGSVYRVRQENINKFVALKFVNVKKPGARKDLKKEAEMQANLRIAGIPHVYDIQEISGQLCIMMEWIQGCNLRILLRNRIPEEHKVAIVFEIITIISSLHKAGYAHRDLKPENIIISSKGVYLVDFGLSRHITSNKQHTGTCIVKGTPGYIAPELLFIDNSDVDPVRADLFSLGKIIIEMFGWDTVPEFITKCVKEEPSLRPDSASELLHEWNKYFTKKDINWDDVKEPYASEFFSKNLYDAAILLIKKQMLEDSYQLLVECLTVNPEFSKAVEVLEQFPSIKKKQVFQKTFTQISIILFFVGTIISFATYFTSKQSVLSEFIPILTGTDSQGLIIHNVHIGTTQENNDLPFKEESIPVNYIYGRIEICPFSSLGKLHVDNGVAKIDSCTTIIQAPGSRQLFTWTNEHDEIVWKEFISALPFEEKRINIKVR